MAEKSKGPPARPANERNVTKIEQTFLLELGQNNVWKKGWTNGTFRYPNMNIHHPG